MAAVTSLASHPRVIIGTASPALTAADLQRAARSLDRHHDAVVIPAADAGYVLVGLKRCDARLFGDIAWGGKDVMATTRERLAVLGWRWYELPSSWDVDRPHRLPAVSRERHHSGSRSGVGRIGARFEMSDTPARRQGNRNAGDPA